MTATYFLTVGDRNTARKLRNCRSNVLEEAEQEADEALCTIREQGDVTSIVRLVEADSIEAESGMVVYAAGLKRVQDRPIEHEHNITCPVCGQVRKVL